MGVRRGEGSSLQIYLNPILSVLFYSLMGKYEEYIKNKKKGHPKSQGCLKVHKEHTKGSQRAKQENKKRRNEKPPTNPQLYPSFKCYSASLVGDLYIIG